MSNMTEDRNKQQKEILDLLFAELDISGAKYQEAEDRYNALGEWLSRPESKVSAFAPQIYVQGSFLLGTVIKPISDDGEYDIDSVCELDLKKSSLTQKQLKELVGFEVKAYAKAQSMKRPVEEGNRCWTLNYADESRFHMDVLPALPDSTSFQLLLEQHSERSDWASDMIAITDKSHHAYDVKSNDWPISNPKGYAKWFKERMRVIAQRQFSESATLLAKYASVEDVPAFTFKTPLQRAIQVLKRHRDLTYDDAPDKPISIIITTLAAHAYNNEADTVLALRNIVDNLLSSIQTKNNVLWISNPVNPFENFADKWPSHPQRQENFFKWHTEVKTYLDKLLGQSSGIQNFSESMTKLAGASTAQAVMKRYGSNISAARGQGLLKATGGAATLGVGLGGTTVLGHTFYGK